MFPRSLLCDTMASTRDQLLQLDDQRLALERSISSAIAELGPLGLHGGLVDGMYWQCS